ncbi:hypothetical protein [Sulfitobacter sp. PS-8MA]|uniref:hypothetical protein n=1 Tax=Sulfitobacter sp. PS-8MA TaxID=3237707 RepID=UPI0034C5F938
MKPLVLRAHIRPLPEYLPRTRAMEETIGVGAGFDGAWYRSQKEHWLGWLSEYSGPGAYGRSEKTKRSAEYAYNHIQCAPMLFWLAEALDAKERCLAAGFEAVLDVPQKGARQCAALRRCIPWTVIENALGNWRYNRIDRCKIKLAHLSR